MDTFAGKLAVVTGGGSGMGRELVVQLVAAGCSVATCDVDPASLAQTQDLAERSATTGARITTRVADVSDAASVNDFRDAVLREHRTDHINLLFNNAGIAGGGSFINAPREEWERTFNIDWGGVYNCTRAFLPLLIASDEGVIVNTSSVNGFWASLGPGRPHTAYSTAKFAVKGFTEALMEDLRLNAPHVKAAVVMPGHIGTNIVGNSRRAHGGSDPDEMTPEELAKTRAQLASGGTPAEPLGDAQVRALLKAVDQGFRDNAPLTAAQAATIILDAVRAGEWRILVGEDAHALDAAVRADPLAAYGPNGFNLATLGGRPALAR
jgi:NAD(P)-dependent dehydrogenase (short-subunit alcohol dehydrogenase family)